VHLDSGGMMNPDLRFEREDWWTVPAVAWSPAGRWLAAGGGPDPELIGPEGAQGAGQVWVWDTESWQPTVELPHEARVTALAASPDGSLLHAGTMTGTLHTWDVARGVEVSRHELGGSVAAIAWPRVAVNDATEIWVWDGEQDEVLVEVERVAEEVEQPGGSVSITYAGVERATLSADGRWLASSHDDGVVQVWDVGSGEAGPEIELVLPDGGWLAPSRDDREVQVSEVVGGEARPEIRPEGRVTALALSADGRWLATAGTWTTDDQSGEAVLQVWETATGREASHWGLDRELSEDDVRALAFTPDGRRLLWGNRQGGGTWHWPPDEILLTACERLTRNLTGAEWQQFVGRDEPYECTCPDLPPGYGAPVDVCLEGTHE
jgi:WD40 repeat protein